jgi:membrane associated rhomboid family serine protease
MLTRRRPAAVWDRRRHLHGQRTPPSLLRRWPSWPGGLLSAVRDVPHAPAHVRAWWGRLPEGSKLTVAVVAANVAVFAAWRVPALRVALNRHFVHSPTGWRVHTALTAGFSHEGGFHLLANMYGLCLFMPLAASVLGAPQTLWLYTGGIIGASYLSTMVRYLGRWALPPTLGASGGVMTVLAAAVLVRPDVTWRVLLLPGVDIGGSSLVAGVAIIDVARTPMHTHTHTHTHTREAGPSGSLTGARRGRGLRRVVMLSGLTRVNHIAHLAGLGVGCAYAALRVDARLWERRSRVLAPLQPMLDRLLAPSSAGPRQL